MTICEYCGRAHPVGRSDRRFCAAGPRPLFRRAAGRPPTGEPTRADYVRTGADYLARKLGALTTQATHLLDGANALDRDTQLVQFRHFLADLARGNSAAEQVNRALDSPAH